VTKASAAYIHFGIVATTPARMPSCRTAFIATGWKMVFTTQLFLFGFLPLTFLIYAALPVGSRNVWLAISSYVFYGWWRPEYCALLAAMTVFNFWCGARIVRSGTPEAKKRFLSFSVIGSLSLLGFFKYSGMLTVWMNAVAELFVAPSAGTNVIPIIEVLLPIGISFYTFQAISYTVDLYRGRANEAQDLVSFAAYIAMFPQLIAGPIVRYEWIADELRERRHGADKVLLGLRFLALGLAKKVVVADTFALAVPLAFDTDAPSFEAAWAGVLSYTLQIYFDFSAYSDMAVGLGLFFGFSFPQNFDSPYKSRSITEFWRRWHITLSTWLRDYLYIPLGGNRKGATRTYLNLMIVMLLGGLWHGASIAFVIWGAWHGALLAVERASRDFHPTRWLPPVAALALTQLLVIIGWVPFRSESWSGTTGILSAMFLTCPSGSWVFAGLSPLVVWLIPLGFLLCWLLPNTWELLERGDNVGYLRDFLLLAVSIAIVLANQASPFLYFQF